MSRIDLGRLFHSLIVLEKNDCKWDVYGRHWWKNKLIGMVMTCIISCYRQVVYWNLQRCLMMENLNRETVVISKYPVLFVSLAMITDVTMIILI